MTITDISFATTKPDSILIGRIVDRALGLRLGDRMSIHMDIAATHCNGNPLRLADLLAADDFNFLHDVHDVCGINRHLNRDTGKLMDHFSPRFSKHESKAA